MRKHAWVRIPPPPPGFMKQTEFKVLVHPDLLPINSSHQDVWTKWKQDGAHVITGDAHDLDEFAAELTDVAYIDNLANGTIIVLGGQWTDLCEDSHYKAILAHPRVKSGNVSVVVDRAASAGNDFRVMRATAELNNIPFSTR